MPAVDSMDPGKSHGSPPTTRIRTIAIAVIATALLGIVVGGVVAPWGSHVFLARSFMAEREMTLATLESWEGRPPAGVKRDAWIHACQTVHSLTSNICYSYHSVSLEEMRRLRADVEARDKNPITIETLEWLRRRLMQTGPRGAEYTQRMTPYWEQAVAQLQAGN